MVQALAKEIELRSKSTSNSQLPTPHNEVIETIYFGGGTPSILSIIEINKIIDAVYQYHSVVLSPEITLEANPHDLS